MDNNNIQRANPAGSAIIDLNDEAMLEYYMHQNQLQFANLVQDLLIYVKGVMQP
jgi:hypothetical protein